MIQARCDVGLFTLFMIGDDRKVKLIFIPIAAAGAMGNVWSGVFDYATLKNNCTQKKELNKS